MLVCRMVSGRFKFSHTHSDGAFFAATVPFSSKGTAEGMILQSITPWSPTQTHMSTHTHVHILCRHPSWTQYDAWEDALHQNHTPSYLRQRHIVLPFDNVPLLFFMWIVINDIGNKNVCRFEKMFILITPSERRTWNNKFTWSRELS